MLIKQEALVLSLAETIVSFTKNWYFRLVDKGRIILGWPLQSQATAQEATSSDRYHLSLILTHFSARLAGPSALATVTESWPTFYSATAGTTNVSLLSNRGLIADKIDEELLRQALEKTNGNRAAAADHLGISRRSLYRLIGKISKMDD